MVTQKTQIKRTGNSLCVVLSKDLLHHVAKLKLGDRVDVEYADARIKINKSNDDDIYPCGRNPADPEAPDGVNCKFKEYKGCAEFKGIGVDWDEDFDVRVLCWINSCDPVVLDHIESVGESKAWLTIVMKNKGSLNPEIFPTAKDYLDAFRDFICNKDGGVSVCGDFWNVRIEMGRLTKEG